MSSNIDAAGGGGGGGDAANVAALVDLFAALLAPPPQVELAAELNFPGIPMQIVYARDLCIGQCSCMACQEDRISLFLYMARPDFPLELLVEQFQEFPITFVRGQMLRAGLIEQEAIAARGVPPAVVAALPKVVVTAEDVTAKATCSVCLSEATEEEVGTEVYQLGCGHKFHQGCLTPWMNDHDSCPNCRKKIG